MKITLCIGSACHKKGSRQIVEQLQSLIEKEKRSDKIELGGTFCTGNCQKGVCVTVDGELYSLRPENVNEFFESAVKPRLSV